MDSLSRDFYTAWRIDWNDFKAGEENSFPIHEIPEEATLQGQLDRHQQMSKMFGSLQEASTLAETGAGSTNLLTRDQEGQLTLFT